METRGATTREVPMRGVAGRRDASRRPEPQRRALGAREPARLDGMVQDQARERSWRLASRCRSKRPLTSKPIPFETGQHGLDTITLPARPLEDRADESPPFKVSELQRGLDDEIRRAWTSRTAMSAGETPAIRDAWPAVAGLTRRSFSRASDERLESVDAHKASGSSQPSSATICSATRRCRSM